MFKKIISIVSAAALGVCCLTGCSNDTAGDKGDKDAKEFFCIDCLADYLGCTVDELLEKIEEFKEEGCTLFK